MKGLNEYYPHAAWNVHVETNPVEILKLLDSKDSTCWGQEPVGETGFFQLVTCSPQHKGDKRFAIVASAADVQIARKLPSQ